MNGTNDQLHTEPTGFVPARKMGPGYENASSGTGSLNQWLPPFEIVTPAPEATARKQRPIATGVLDYFPDAVAAVAHLSFVGNEQHNPGQPLHWDRSKSTDEADALIRHFLQRGTTDSDGIAHSAKVAWRALALLQKEIEAAREPAPLRCAAIDGTYGRQRDALIGHKGLHTTVTQDNGRVHWDPFPPAGECCCHTNYYPCPRHP